MANDIYLKCKNKLDELYLKAEKNLKKNNDKIEILKDLSKDELAWLDEVIRACEHRKAILTVLITLLSYKTIKPEQDIRLHQANLENGFSGRTYDTQIVTPFMKEKNFPAMVESGWLTRSLEQNRPYDLEYPGKITPKDAKKAFLNLINHIEEENKNPETYLYYLMQKLIIYREAHTVEIVVEPLKELKPEISVIITILKNHFDKCSEEGKARLPVLALYSIYEIITDELSRYEHKKLQKLESHTSADARSGEIGDIDVLYENGKPFEGVEVKYGKPITAQMIKDAYEKFKQYPVERYYLLSTVKPKDIDEINETIDLIRKEHGCQIIINGILETIKYYLRLINDTNEFLDNYKELIENDDVIKKEHKLVWNELISEYIEEKK